MFPHGDVFPRDRQTPEGGPQAEGSVQKGPLGIGAGRAATHRAGDGAVAGRTGKRGGGLTGWRAHRARSGCNRRRPAGCTAPAAFASLARRWCSPPGLATTPAAKAKKAD